MLKKENFFLKSNFFFVLVFLLFLILFSGCLDNQKLSIEERLTCLDLTSKSYAFVPQCNSESECFQKVENAFFDFPQDYFSEKVSQELYYYKNDLALSWFYYNKSLENIKKINKICDLQENLQDLEIQLNEFNRNLQNAFSKADDCGKRSISVLLLEQKSLNDADLNLIREERLFDDFVLINQNLSELSNPNIVSSDSFASVFFRSREKFNRLSSQYGFQPAVLNEVSLLDFAEKYDEKILKQFPGYNSNFFVPIFANAVSSTVSYFNNSFRMGNAVNALKHFPSFEFLESFNELAGIKNSAAESFAKIIRNDSINRKSLFEESKNLESMVESGLSSTEQKIDLFKKELSAMDSSFEKILSMFEVEGILPQHFSIQNLSEFDEKSGKQLFETKTAFVETKRQFFLGKISIGKTVSSFKKNLDALAGLNENIDFLSQNSVQGLNALCSEKIAQIEEETKKAEIGSQAELVELKSRTLFRTSQFNESVKEKKLFYCSQAIASFQEFKNALFDLKKFGESQRIEKENCLNFIERLFDEKIYAYIDGVDWQYFFQKFNSLNESFAEKTAADAKLSCMQLKAEIENSVYSTAKIMAIGEKYSNCKEILSKLEIISKHYPFALKEETFNALAGSFSKFEKFFPDNKFGIFNAPSIDEVFSSLLLEESEMNSKFKDSVLKYIEKNFEIRVFSEPAMTGQDFNVFTTILMQNPFGTLNEPIVAEIPFDENPGEKFFFSSNVISAKKSGDFLWIDLNFVPEGETILEFLRKEKNPEEKTLIPIAQDFKEFEKTVSKKNELFSKTIALLEDENSSLEKETFLEMNLELEKAISSNDLQKSKILLQNFEDFSKRVEKESLEKKSILAKTFFGMVSDFEKNIATGEKNLEEMGFLLESVSEGELGLKFIPPISKSQLEKLKLKLDFAKSLSLMEKIEKFKEFYKNKDFGGAIGEFGSFEKSLGDSSASAKGIVDKLDSAMNAIKEEAMVSYNSAAALFNSGGKSDPDAAEEIGRAKTALQEKSFLESILHSNNATSMLSALKQKEKLDLPIAFYPIIVAVLILAFLRFKKKKDLELRKARIQKILRKW